VRESEEEMETSVIRSTDVFWFAILCATLVAILLLFKLVGWIKDRRDGKRKYGYEARGNMLRTLPQLSFEDFRQVVEQLGWVAKDLLTGDYMMVLPDSSFAPMNLIALTFDSIASNWIYWSNVPTDYELLAFLVVDKYTIEEQDEFVSGIAVNGFGYLVTKERSSRASDQNQQTREQIIESGLKAAGVK
ncbi:MAG: hypothetical protein NTV48_00560, partial [Candidatus Vogelbacteria bacterium]|nr:hypothetical protein [Candidatus Vogelbacteria bacterium]